MKVIVALLCAVVAALFYTVWTMEGTIEIMLLSQSIETSRSQAQSIDIATLQRRFDSHMESLQELQKKLDFVQAQSDWVMAARRCGKSEYKLYADMFGLEN